MEVKFVQNEVNDYLEQSRSPWPREVLIPTIEAIRSSAEFEEAIKWDHPYFALNGKAVVKLFPAKDWLNLFFYRGADLSDPDGLLEGEGTSAMRKLRLHRNADSWPIEYVKTLCTEAAKLAEN